MFEIRLEHIPGDLHEVLQRFADGGFEVWLVGGALRDTLLGLRPKDWDVATSAAPEEVMSLFARVIPIGVRHGTVQVRTPVRSIEVTSCPTGGREGILGDLGRRDFTVNALALSYPDGQLLDPFGGQGDLHAGILRAVADARARFHEDPLRTLRAGRFVSVYGFKPEPQMLAAIVEAAPWLQGVACERIREEFFKMLVGEHFGDGFDLMRRGRVLPEILPELSMLRADGVGPAHEGEADEHVVRAVQFCPHRIQVRLAALFHHLGEEGKEGLKQEMPHLAVSTRRSAWVAKEILQRWRASQRLTREVVGLVVEQLPEDIEAWSNGDVRRFLARIGLEQLDDVMALARADRMARRHQPGGPRAVDELRRRVIEVLKDNPPLQLQDLAISGRDIMHALRLRSGPIVGRLLQSLLQQVLENPAGNDPKFLMDFLKKEYTFKFQLPQAPEYEKQKQGE